MGRAAPINSKGTIRPDTDDLLDKSFSACLSHAAFFVGRMALRQGDPDVAELGLLLLTSAHIDRARSAADGTGRRRSALLGTCADAFALGTANRCGEGGRTSLNSSFRTAGGASDAKGIAHTHGSLPRESSGLVCAFGLRPTLVAATKAAAAAFRRLGLAGAWSLQEERLICEPSSGISASSSSSTETLTGTLRRQTLRSSPLKQIGLACERMATPLSDVTW